MRKTTIERTGSPLVLDTPITTWATKAACKGEELELFFGPDHEKQADREKREQEALSICRTCTVVDECLESALSQGARQWGVQGGMSADQRRAVRKSRDKLAAEEAPAPKPKKPQRSSTGRVDVVGTMRRLQALAVIGHSPKAIGAVIGASSSYLNDLRTGGARMASVSVEVADALAREYPRLVRTPPGVQSALTMRNAAKQGWDGPPAWVGVDMDDPAARPREAAAAA